MKFATIEPVKKRVRVAEFRDLHSAVRSVGVDPHATDHGVVQRNHRGPNFSIVVYEFGLFTPVADQHYFATGGRLYAGNAVLYGFNEIGETVDVVEPLPDVTFFADAPAVELAIAARVIPRPRMSANGMVIWEWPNPAPVHMQRHMRS